MPLSTRLALFATAVLCWIIAAALALARHRRVLRAGQQLAREVESLEAAQRRQRKAEDEAARGAVRDALLALLPVLDNLDRALQAGQAAQASGGPSVGLVEGLQLTRKTFLDALRGLGVEPVPAAGLPFDPHVHEATLQVESTDLDPGTVATVYQEGFRMGPRLLRPAQVAVSRRP